MSKSDNIRNFAIIAHIDHGKSTLADRIIEFTSSIDKRLMKNQLLDSMDLEREKGITIKLNTIRLEYVSKLDGKKYILNLIDTPGHHDFSYEVSRSIAACEGVILLVDATQGIQSQTIANLEIAKRYNLKIIPVINKVDLPAANVEKVSNQLIKLLNLKNNNDILSVSAKTGKNINLLIESIIHDIKPINNKNFLKKEKNNEVTKALIFDSYYDKYLGVVLFLKVFSGTLKKKDKIFFYHTNSVHEIVQLGIKKISLEQKDTLEVGEVGWLSASIKDIQHINIGDTITLENNKCIEPLEGYKKIKPMVYSSFFNTNQKQYLDFKKALEKIRLVDSVLTFENEYSDGLGAGFRCGFLGILHMEIIKERLEREFQLDLIVTVPTVNYKIITKKNETLFLTNPKNFPKKESIKKIFEPFVLCSLFCNIDSLSKIISLCKEKRGIYQNQVLLEDINKIKLSYLLPLNEIIFDFSDKIKSLSQGYASFEYSFYDYFESNVVKADIKLNDKIVNALSFIVHNTFAYKKLKQVVEKLKELLPRQNFQIAIQGAIGTKILARETIKALRKNVTAKLYGGDITRKMKLREKQKKGKKKMRMFGKIKVPKDIYLKLLKIN